MKKALLIILIILIVAGFTVLGWQLKIYYDYTWEMFGKNEDLKAELSDAQGRNTELESEIEVNKGTIAYLRGELVTKTDEISSLEDKVVCVDRPRISHSYKTNQEASDKLETWLGDVEGSVNEAEWDVIWTNSKAAIHNQYTSEFLHVFLVFFNEPDLNKEDAYFGSISSVG